VFRIRNEASSAPGPELNENERAWSVPGTWMFTYCPGRKPSAARSSSLMENASAVSESVSFVASSPVKVCRLVFATSDVAGIRMMQSDFAVIWHVRT
jgi:hypothetical protein